ncbi:MAG: nuclease [Moraxellaceae bacterium]|jgi:hypothetical protein|nr:nuclease [Moraxellaceae bacterium]
MKPLPKNGSTAGFNNNKDSRPKGLMATIYPENWQELRAAFMHDAERDMLDRLAAALPDRYAIFPNLSWVTLSSKRKSKFGEIDFCIVAPSGDLIIIEQKNGGLMVDEQGRLLKSYAENPGKDVGQQIMNSVSVVKNALKYRYQGRSSIAVDYLLVCPDYHLRSYQGLQLNPQRIIDSTQMERLGEIVQEIHADKPTSPDHVSDVVNFLLGELDLAPDLGASMERQQAVYRGFATELGEWVDRLSFQPWSLHVTGCAGSGKTQLARHLAQRALSRGLRPLYTCFNRPLADALRPFFPAGCHVANLDHLVREVLEARGELPAFGEQGPDFFMELRQAVLAHPLPEDWRFDVLIVDEGQDFDAEMAATARHFLREGGELIWLEDPYQRLQERDYQHAGTVHLHLDRNYRSPRRIAELLSPLLHLPGMTAANPIAGEEPRFHQHNGDTFHETLQRVVQEQLARFAPEDLAIVSLKGRGKSALGDDTVAGLRVKTFTGTYEANGQPVFSEGELRCETLFRFKGQQAKAVILIDLDFEEITERTRNLLYCGMTRATFSLDVLHTGAAGVAIGRYAAQSH